MPYSTENRSNSDSTALKRYQGKKKKKTCTGLAMKHFISFVELCGKKIPHLITNMAICTAYWTGVIFFTLYCLNTCEEK